MMKTSTITLITESVNGCYDNQLEELLDTGYLIDSEEQIFTSDDGTATLRYVLIKGNNATEAKAKRHRDRFLSPQ